MRPDLKPVIGDPHQAPGVPLTTGNWRRRNQKLPVFLPSRIYVEAATSSQVSPCYYVTLAAFSSVTCNPKSFWGSHMDRQVWYQLSTSWRKHGAPTWVVPLGGQLKLDDRLARIQQRLNVKGEATSLD